jgi:hypothetical protein
MSILLLCQRAQLPEQQRLTDSSPVLETEFQLYALK